ncbi:MAG: hypothetical protein GX235_01835 [Clostridiales bacterium]|nr:hypothetical protein [Clostridiales bacterium]
MAENEDKKELSERELLEEILEENKIRTFYSKVTAISTVGILAVIVVCMLILLPRTDELIRNADTAIDAAKVTLAEAERAAVGLSQMSRNVTQTSKNVDAFVSENSTVIADTMTDISAIDYESLNKAIKDLEDAVAPFASFMNKFK